MLRKFDEQMNGRGIQRVRYIDDFILIGNSEKNVIGAYKSARTMLLNHGMDVYDLADARARAKGKVDSGNIHDGTDVLGYRISGLSRQPCASACDRFLEKLKFLAATAKRSMHEAVLKTSNSHRHRYHQSMVLFHDTIWGWSQAFCHTTAKHVFEALDMKIDAMLRDLQREAKRLAPPGDMRSRRRVAGIHCLLHDRPSSA